MLCLIVSKASAKFYVAVVEGDEAHGRSLGRLLMASGYQPVTYLSAEAFLDDSKRPVFDCLIVDTQLGGISGIEFEGRLTNSGSSTPVVFVAGSDEIGDLEKRFKGRRIRLVRKCDPGSILLSAINKVISSPAGLGN